MTDDEFAEVRRQREEIAELKSKLAEFEKSPTVAIGDNGDIELEWISPAGARMVVSLWRDSVSYAVLVKGKTDSGHQRFELTRGKDAWSLLANMLENWK